MVIDSEPPLEEDLRWINHGIEIIKESPSLLDENAKSLITLGSSLLAVYIGALELFSLGNGSQIDQTMLFIPIILWLSSIGANIYVYLPGRYDFEKNSPSEIKRTVERVSDKKYKRLRYGAVLFMVALIASVLVIFWFIALPHVQTIQFFVPEDEIPTLQNMSISFENKSQRTTVLDLLKSTDDTYLVRTSSGTKVELSRSMVKGVIIYHTLSI